jgi:molybdopterin converting factor small subunit
MFTLKSVMKIFLQLYSILREKLPSETNGQAGWQMKDGMWLQDLIDKLDTTLKVVIRVNDSHETDMSRLFKDGDQVNIFSSISGG